MAKSLHTDWDTYWCTEGHVQQWPPGSRERNHYCQRRVREGNGYVGQQEVWCNAPCRIMKPEIETMFRIGGEEAIKHLIERCLRCGLTAGAWCHQSGARTSEWHSYEPPA